MLENFKYSSFAEGSLYKRRSANLVLNMCCVFKKVCSMKYSLSIFVSWTAKSFLCRDIQYFMCMGNQIRSQKRCILCKNGSPNLHFVCSPKHIRLTLVVFFSVCRKPATQKKWPDIFIVFQKTHSTHTKTTKNKCCC